MEAAFSRRVTDVGDVHLVSLAGELDMATAVGLADWLVSVAGSDVVVDLSGLSFVDSTGIAALAQARGLIEQAGSELRLTRPQRPVERVLEIVGLAGWVDPWQTAWDPDHGA